MSFKMSKQVQEEKELSDCLKARTITLPPKYKKHIFKLMNTAKNNLKYLDKLLKDDTAVMSAPKPQTTSAASKRYRTRNIEMKNYIREEAMSDDEFMPNCHKCSRATQIFNIFKQADGAARRYPKRSIEKKSYVENEVLTEDESPCYSDYGRENVRECTVHELFIRESKMKPLFRKNPARMLCHPYLSVFTSGFKLAGLGVWTESNIAKGVVFGPYCGNIGRVSKEVQRNGYAWQVKKSDSTHYYIVDWDRSMSNWMLFINCADSEESQNLIPFQFRNKIYYRTCKEVIAHTELLVWNRSDHTRDLGIDLLEKKDEEQAVAVRRYECDVCHLLLSSEEYLVRHRRSHRHQGSDRKHQCCFCPYSTNVKNNLQTHLRTHTEERPYSCENCGRTFTRVSNLQAHLRIHSGDKPYQCNKCLKEFRQKSTVCVHERTHSNIRPFVCSTCGKGFIQKVTLHKHVLTHTGQKPYKCGHCRYKAARRDTLQQHVTAIHTKKFLHVCGECGKGFSWPCHLRYHVKTVHGDLNRGKEE